MSTKILAANMWDVWHLGNPDSRYQKFLSSGKDKFKSYIENLLIYDQAIIPTQDFLSLTILIGVLGEDSIQDLIASGNLKFVRLKGAFAYVGNGVGIEPFEMFSGEKEKVYNAMCSDLEFAIHWAINGLTEKPKDKHLLKKIADNTIEVDSKSISTNVKDETYKDISSNQNIPAATYLFSASAKSSAALRFPAATDIPAALVILPAHLENEASEGFLTLRYEN